MTTNNLQRAGLRPLLLPDSGASFKDALTITLEHEGGYVNDPNDAGGETNFGISSRAFPMEDVRNITIERASYLYERHYWFPLRLDAVHSQLVANNLFDFAVHHGVRGVGKKWQLVLARSFGFKGKVDGLIGSETVSFTNSVLAVPGNEVELNAKLTQARVDYYLQTAKPVYLKGFVGRAIKFL